MSPGEDTAARTRRYYAIAHRAGNNLHDLERALAAGVDAIECDFWHDHGRLALRHERKLPALPVWYDRWYIRFSIGELSLPDLLREINFRSELFLDIKSSTPLAAEAVLRLYHDNASMMPRTLVSSRQWRLLDQLGEVAGREAGQVGHLRAVCVELGQPGHRRVARGRRTRPAQPRGGAPSRHAHRGLRATIRTRGF